MSGLLQKDFCLLIQRKQALILFLGIAIIMGISTDGTFVIGYCTMLMAIFTISTANYDEFDNCMPFLMTLPITTKTYTKEKYLFCMAGGVIGWIVSVFICMILSFIRGEISMIVQQWAEIVIFLPIFTIIIGLMLPIQLKYGMEKSRIVMAVFGGVIAVIAVLAQKLVPERILNRFECINQLSEGGIVAGAFAICILVLACSYWYSLGVMEKKKY